MYPSLNPYSASPNAPLAPQGIVGGIAGNFIGGQVGNLFGQGDLGRTVGSVIGGFLPFSAGPQVPVPSTPLAPMGAGGSAVGGYLGNQVGNWIGGYGDIGRTVGSTLGGFLPFSAGPQVPVPSTPLAPMGAGGSAMGGYLGNQVGNWIGGYGDIGRTVGSTLGGFLPFSAVPVVG